MNANTRPLTGHDTSSCIKDVTACDGDMILEFHSGKTYQFAGAGSHVGPLLAAPSAGRYFNANVKGAYAAAQV